MSPNLAATAVLLSMAFGGLAPLHGKLVASVQSAPNIQEARSVPRMTVEELRKGLAQNQMVVVDVRDTVAFTNGHIPGALSAPAKDIAGRVAEIKRLAGSRVVVLYCSCAAEQSAAEAGLVLLRHGLEGVSALIGGYPEWIHSGGRSEGGREAP